MLQAKADPSSGWLMSTELAQFAARLSMIDAAATSASKQVESSLVQAQSLVTRYGNGIWWLLDDISEDCRTCPTQAHRSGLWPAIESRPAHRHDRSGHGPIGTSLVAPSPSTRRGRRRRPSLPLKGPTRATSCPGSEQNARMINACSMQAKDGYSSTPLECAHAGSPA